MEPEKPKKKPCPARMALDALSKALESFGEAKAEREQCWQFMRCPKDVFSRCPAFERKSGRRCWLIAGTLSGGAPYCIYCKQIKSCKECRFYIKIKSATQ
jgi:hypothetical protein